MSSESVSVQDALHLGLQAHQRGDRAHARHIYDTILAMVPDQAATLYYRGMLAYEDGDLEGATRWIERAATAEPTVADFHATLGTLALNRGSAPMALQRFQKALALEPEHPEAMVGLGLAYLALRRRDLAVDQLRKAVARHPNLESAQLAIARALAARSEHGAAIAAFRRALSCSATSLDAYIGIAASLIELSRLDEAKSTLEAASGLAPDSPLVQLLLGKIARESGDLDEALFCYLEALRLDETSSEAYYNLANCHMDLGSIDRAIEYYKKALELKPDNVDVLTNLGIALRRNSDLEGAETYLTRAINLSRNNSEALRSLGSVNELRGDLTEASKRLDQAFELDYKDFNATLLPPRQIIETSSLEVQERIGRLRGFIRQATDLSEFALRLAQLHTETPAFEIAAQYYQKQAAIIAASVVATGMLAEAYRALGQLDVAEKKMNEAVEFKSNLAIAHYNAGIHFSNAANAERAALELEHARALDPENHSVLSALASQYVNIGRLAEAEPILRSILAKDPDRSGDLNNLALALNTLGRPDEALEHLRRAVELQPTYAAGWSHIGGILHSKGRIAESKEAYLKALECEPDSPQSHNNLALVYQAITEYEPSLYHLRRAQELAPTNAAFHSNLLFGMQYDPAVTARDLYLETMRWGELHAAPHYPTDKVFANVRDPERRLRIGYLSPDFRGHSVSYFLHPLYANHDRSQVEVFSYAEVPSPDFWTDRFRSMSDGWRVTCGIKDADLAQRIEADQIDVLIDLGAHTGGSRATVLAYKPAPIQVSFLGLGNTTGIKTVDYILSDPHFAPPGTEEYYCEQVYRLPSTLYCYDPLHEFPAVAPLPALANGHLTFGSFSRTVRFNPQVIDAWSKILLAIPNARLVLNTISFVDESTREMFWGFFAKHGVDRSRVSLIYTNPPEKTWATYNTLDIALDPFPHNAGLTTCEALWMGCPVLSLADRPPQGRYGASYLANVGLPGFVAHSVEELVQIAVGWAGRIDELAEVRATLRPKMAASRFRDAKAYTRDFEAAFRDMWRQYCA